MIREFGINIHTLLYLKWITNKEQVQHRELCSMVHGSLDGRGVWGEWIHVYIRLSPSTVHLKLSQHC